MWLEPRKGALDLQGLADGPRVRFLGADLKTRAVYRGNNEKVECSTLPLPSITKNRKTDCLSQLQKNITEQLGAALKTAKTVSKLFGGGSKV